MLRCITKSSTIYSLPGETCSPSCYSIYILILKLTLFFQEQRTCDILALYTTLSSSHPAGGSGLWLYRQQPHHIRIFPASQFPKASTTIIGENLREAYLQLRSNEFGTGKDEGIQKLRMSSISPTPRSNKYRKHHNSSTIASHSNLGQFLIRDSNAKRKNQYCNTNDTTRSNSLLRREVLDLDVLQLRDYSAGYALWHS